MSLSYAALPNCVLYLFSGSADHDAFGSANDGTVVTAKGVRAEGRLTVSEVRSDPKQKGDHKERNS